jgi:general secretion pathway protein K
VNRRGFALLTVLWIMAAAAVVAMAMQTTARASVSSATNRVDLERAMWRAMDCLERDRAVIDDALAEASRTHTTRSTWRALDLVVAEAPLLRGENCQARLLAAGSRLDVNAASDLQLRRVLAAAGVTDPQVLVDRLLDWRDADDDARAYGAESGYYLARGLPAPRNGPVQAIRELAALDPGVSVETLESVLSTEPGRISLNHAPRPVLHAIPGLTLETVERILTWREIGHTVDDVGALAERLSPPSVDSLMAHFPEIVAAATVDPDAWLVLARGSSGAPPLTVRVDARLVLDGSRAAVVRRRILP